MTRLIPKEEGLDHSLAFLREGYLYVPNRRKSFQSNLFETRLLGERAICLGGAEAAALFYDADKFVRKDAAPKRLLKTLFGEDGVQTLDGAAHAHRKKMFMSLMFPGNIERLTRLVSREWERALDAAEDETVLYHMAQEVLMRAVCEWAGIPLGEHEVKQRTDEMRLLFESGTALGPKHIRGRAARSSAESWVRKMVEEVRTNRLLPNEQTALYEFSWHRDEAGELLPADVVAVEVINIIRPTVAVSIYVLFTVLALHQFPEARARLAYGETDSTWFVQEVRRFYPFFPVTAARVKQDFEWDGFAFEQGTLVLLDLYGTNHDPSLWTEPEQFNPDRFKGWTESPFTFIPQGGGDVDFGHRCAGEHVTIAIMRETIDVFLNRYRYEVPSQDLSYSFVDLPSLPKSGLVLKRVERK
ncbi:cytochrome P450 [Exiguobacterium mexicanum]|uniref:Cytochrome P450 n=2 Tax=Bacillales Family XII. Incertae Sedis TaxID=539742 RepID=A0ABT7MQR8_9BACL|nr:MULTISPECIES: cytochrome P450 [Exiguobacterium]MDL5377545.1 cytochrome P450 [Exiguobacterium mexicanum]